MNEKAVAPALGTPLHPLEGEWTGFDRLLAEIWPETTTQLLRLLVGCRTCPAAAEVLEYAEYLRDLLNAHLSNVESVAGPEATLEDLVEEARRDYDLVIFGEPDQSLIKRLLAGPVDRRAVERVPTSVLIARQPRQPLRRILLITRCHRLDDVAVDWAVRLAEPSAAALTVLAVTVPPVPAMYDVAARMPHGLVDWLTSDTVLGEQLRYIAWRLVDWERHGTLRLRPGAPEWQIQRELVEGDYDLTIIAADPSGWWQRRLLGQLVSPLLDRANWPVLIAKPTTA